MLKNTTGVGNIRKRQHKLNKEWFWKRVRASKISLKVVV